MASAWALIVDDDQILLVQRAATTSRPLQWCLPGGGIKSGETADDACVREAFEETGLITEIDNRLAQIGDSTYFHCRLTGSRDNLTLHHKECQASMWSVPDEILQVGQIMELSRLIPLLRVAGLQSPPVPEGLELHRIH
jgi:8-oxo-dGTP diphosphatase